VKFPSHLNRQLRSFKPTEMKKFTLGLATAMLLLTFTPAQVRAEAKPTPISTPVESPEVRAMLNRLEEINAIDKSTLKPAEKKELRKEVRTIKRDLKATGGVYLSVSALLLVIILLIILL